MARPKIGVTIDPYKKESPQDRFEKERTTVIGDCCGKCVFYRAGWCRRFPDGRTKNGTDWCGEYKHREVIQ